MILYHKKKKNISLIMFFDINGILQIDSKNRVLAQNGKLAQMSKRSIIKRDFNLIAEYDRRLYDSRIAQMEIVKSDNWLLNKYDSSEYN